MNSTAAATAGAVTFVWLGMVLAISFLEAPLKFRAPGVTILVGLAIGRLVFRALNAVEMVLAVVVVLAVALGDAPAAVISLTAAVAALLLAQLAVVRPFLNRRSDRVLAGEELPRSRSHLWYVALEVLKAGALIALGVALLTA
ncbi:membrane protein [Streptomyces hygroscopicus subsp. limoneus]|nr:membrane protein [Streptomyces hygroscopicus subsp. limoneus]